MGNGLGFQENLEYGIHINWPNFAFKYGMILIRLRAKKMDARFYLLRFTRSDPGSLAVGKRRAGLLFSGSCNLF